MKRLSIIVVSLILALFLTLPVYAATVIQGESLDDFKEGETKTIKVKEYDTNFSKDTPYGKPTDKVSEYDVTEETLVGRTPSKGNILRIAYREEGGKRKAIRIMNATKQDIMKK